MSGMIILIGVGLFGLVLGLLLSLSWIRKIGAIQQTPMAYISALPPQGRVEVAGKAEGATIHSPLAKSKCVLWASTVMRMERRDLRRDNHWTTLYNEASGEAFYVNDGTGKIEIRPAGAEIDLHHDLFASYELLTQLEPQLKTAIKELGIETGALGFNRKLEVHERILEPGEQIYVIGQLATENGQRVIAAGENTPLILSDVSERQLLTKYYWQVVAVCFISIVLVYGFYGMMSSYFR